MNSLIICGRICAVPKFVIINVGSETVAVCKYVVAVSGPGLDYNVDIVKDVYDESKVDIFECLAVKRTAQMINDNFVKGSKILLKGRLKNYRFEDSNSTKHFTNIILTEQAEFGDTESAFHKIVQKNKSADLAIVSDLREVESIYERLCAEGLLCIDENDYYYLASMCM